jgi:hypothetical protein
MSAKGENIRIVNLDSFILMLIMVLGLLVYNSTDTNHTDRNKNLASTEISLSQSSATFCSGIQLQVLQKTWISFKDSFKLLSYSSKQYMENKKAEQKISLIQTIRENTKSIPILSTRFHLFPSESDDLPILS